MSSRSLRRLQEQTLEEQLEANLVVDDEQTDCNAVKKKKKNKKKPVSKTGNLFDLLEDEDHVSKDDNDDDDEVDSAIKSAEENPFESPPEKGTKKKKKKKKKRGKKEENIEEKKDEEDSLDEIDRSVKEVNQMLGITETNANTSACISYGETPIFRSKSILTVDPRNLNPANEMKRKFGISVVQNGERRRNPHERRFRKVTSMVTPRQTWPPFTKLGIAMSQVKSEKRKRVLHKTLASKISKSLFTFEHQEIYRKVQFMFYDAVESIDHNNIVSLLNNHPYHIDSMLQLSEICKINEDFQMAAELIERALYVFECSFHTLFNITQGVCRLEYRRTENRPFFLALFRHIHYTGDKACYRTALEFCKVLLGLDPSEDPLCVLLMLDYYALKADEYKYLIQLTDEYECSRNVSLLPNFAYSYALAKFYSETEEIADEALRKALISFPSLVVELMDKNGISLDDVIKSHPYFDRVSYITQSPSLNQLISLYVGRCSSLYKPPEVIDWIAKNCKHIIDHMEEYKEEMLEAKISRDTRYKISPRNILRHIIISDIKDAFRHLPVDIRNQTVMQYDPLPPVDSITGYERPTRSNQSSQSEGNLLSLFLQSLMPSYNQNEPLPRQEEEDLLNQARALENDHQEEREGINALRGGAQQLMNAMRELLTTMTYRNDGVPNEGGEDDDDDGNRPHEDEWLD